jgi:hypothetical protein
MRMGLAKKAKKEKIKKFYVSKSSFSADPAGLAGPLYLIRNFASKNAPDPTSV